MPLNDHVLLLQLERAEEALRDRVDILDDEDRHESCDCDCFETAEDDLRHDVDRLEERCEQLEVLITTSREGWEEERDRLDAEIDSIKETVRTIVRALRNQGVRNV
jgi:flagellar motility protein MotE (MotC chaperone)